MLSTDIVEALRHGEHLFNVRLLQVDIKMEKVAIKPGERPI
jgi:hypothetical protein